MSPRTASHLLVLPGRAIGLRPHVWVRMAARASFSEDGVDKRRRLDWGREDCAVEFEQEK